MTFARLFGVSPPPLLSSGSERPEKLRSSKSRKYAVVVLRQYHPHSVGNPLESRLVEQRNVTIVEGKTVPYTSSKRSRMLWFGTHNLLIPLEQMHGGREHPHGYFGAPCSSVVSNLGRLCG